MINITILNKNKNLGQFKFPTIPNVGDVLDFSSTEKYEVYDINWIKLSDEFYPEINVKQIKI